MADLDRLDAKSPCIDPKFQELLKTTDLTVLQKMLFGAPENQQKIGENLCFTSTGGRPPAEARTS
jgi:hypothetical protein